MNKELSLRIATKLIKQFEGCELRAYPDPASPLYREMVSHGILSKYLKGEMDLPDYLLEMDGKPWTIGWGRTKGVKSTDKCTQEQADKWLEEEVAAFMEEVLTITPELASQPSEKLAAVTSLAYNIGTSNYSTSSIAKGIHAGDYILAADAFLLWNKAGKPLKEVPGLTRRRKAEKDLFTSVRG